MFYAPHWIWKQLEGNRLNNILVGLNLRIADQGDKEKKVDQLNDYMKARLKENKGRDHQIWAIKFFICECLNLGMFINFVDIFWGFDHFGLFLDNFKPSNSHLERILTVFNQK